jgi:low affinity Fe/Cu permease
MFRMGPPRKLGRVRQLLLRLVRGAPDVIGSPYAFATAVAAVVLWLLVGPILRFSSGWLVLPATVTSIGAFIVVFLIQYSQNRDTRVMQIKLDEIIRALEESRTDLVRAENRTDEELARIEDEFEKIRSDEVSQVDAAREGGAENKDIRGSR